MTEQLTDSKLMTLADEKSFGWMHKIELNYVYRLLVFFSHWIRTVVGSMTTREIAEFANANVIAFALRSTGAQITDNAIWRWALAVPSNMLGLNILKALLSQWGVTSKFLKISDFSASEVKKLQYGTILVLKNGQVANYLSCSMSGIKVKDGQFRIRKIKFDELASFWGGVFISTDTTSAFSVKGFQAKMCTELLRRVQLALWAIVVVGTVSLACISSFNQTVSEQQYYWLFLAFLGAVGGGVSFNLVKYYLFGEHALPKFCNTKNDSKSNSCSKVLTSNNSTFFGIPHADLGVSYFLVILTLLIMTGLNSYLLVLVSSIGLPYVVYSVCYQMFVVKSWCRLCLVVQATVLLQNFALLHYLMTQNKSINSALYLSTNFLLKEVLAVAGVFSVWSLVRLLITTSSGNNKLTKLNHTQLYDQSFYERQLNSSRDVTPLLGHQILSIKHPSLKATTVTLVLSTHCKQCAETLDDFLRIVDTPYLPMSLNILLKDKLGDAKDQPTEPLLLNDSSKVARSVMALMAQGQTVQAIKVLQQWYNDGQFVSYQYWQKLLPPLRNEDLLTADEILRSTFQWAENNEITMTPMVIWGNKILPEIYLSHEANLMRRVLTTG
jgi:uncharacterized membrane protein